KHRPLVTFATKNVGCFEQRFTALVECQITEHQGHLLFFIEAERELRRLCIQSWQLTRNSHRQHGNLGPKRRGVSLQFLLEPVVRHKDDVGQSENPIYQKAIEAASETRGRG